MNILLLQRNAVELTEECRENRWSGWWMVTAANGSYYWCWISAHGELFFFSFVRKVFSACFF